MHLQYKFAGISWIQLGKHLYDFMLILLLIIDIALIDQPEVSEFEQVVNKMGSNFH